MSELTIFTSESVTEGHPDKLCDQVSDAVLDEILRQDPRGRAAVETVAANGVVHVFGEVSTTGYVDIPALVRETVLRIGYNSSQTSFDGNTCGVIEAIIAQSPDISEGVGCSLEWREGQVDDELLRQGAGDQGTMFGYACNQTEQLMPMPIMLAHRMAERLAQVRKADIISGLYPDGKTQVSLGYDSAGVPKTIEAVVLSAQHSAETDLEQLRAQLAEAVIQPIIASSGLDASAVQLFINPAGRFVLGGPAADSGLTGRKIIVDSYGSAARHGGGAFSGKDPSKADRFGAYMARWVAKHIVAADLAAAAEVQISYAIGKAYPVALNIDTFGTERVDTDRLKRAVWKVFDLRPAAVIERLDLLRPIYLPTAAYGHFGRELPDFTWEQITQLDNLLRAV